MRLVRTLILVVLLALGAAAAAEAISPVFVPNGVAGVSSPAD
jgi:hypothetical protein